MRAIMALWFMVAASGALASETDFVERTVLAGNAINIKFLNLGSEPARTVFYCSSSLSEGFEIMSHDRMGGVVMLAPSVVVLKNIKSDDANAAPYIRIECRAP
jgi:hypothetical protein